GRAWVDEHTRNPRSVDQRGIKLDEVRGAHYAIEGRPYPYVRNRRELEIDLVSVGRTGGRVDRVPVAAADCEVVDQGSVLRERDAELQKPLIDGDLLVDGRGARADTGQFVRRLGGTGGILQSLRAMLGSSIESNAFARPRRSEPIPTEFSGDVRLDDL